jgi:hypothetical protein
LQAKLALWHMARRSWLVTFNVRDAGLLRRLQAAVVEKRRRLRERRKGGLM